jgi:hypothetical protein
MSQQRHLVMFVKAPLAGAVKTRLAAEIGADAACRFYHETTCRILGRVGRDARWTTWLAVTPDRYVEGQKFWPPQFTRLPQGGGDLGARMARTMRDLPPGPAAIIGSDIPDLSAIHVARAFDALDHHEVVFGPAPDGGFWLVALRRQSPAPDIFRNVRWSSPQALADTLANLAPDQAVGMLEELADIDDGADFARWRRTMQRQPTGGDQRGGSTCSLSRGSSSTKLHGR